MGVAFRHVYSQSNHMDPVLARIRAVVLTGICNVHCFEKKKKNLIPKCL